MKDKQNGPSWKRIFHAYLFYCVKHIFLSFWEKIYKIGYSLSMYNFSYGAFSMEPSTIFFAFLLAAFTILLIAYILWIFYQRGAESESEEEEENKEENSDV